MCDACTFCVRLPVLGTVYRRAIQKTHAFTGGLGRGPALGPRELQVQAAAADPRRRAGRRAPARPRARKLRPKARLISENTGS